MMKIKLVFYDWLAAGLRCPLGSEKMNLEAGDFHGGSTFPGTIDLDEEQEKELSMALREGWQPLFWVMPGRGLH